jgi:hypothetical protein
MLQKTYSIYSDDLADARLFIEAGKNHIACWCKKTGDARLRAFEFFQCDAHTEESFEELIDNVRLQSKLLTQKSAGTYFFWNTSDVLCLPKENNETDFIKQNFELLSGNASGAMIFSQPAEECLIAWRISERRQQIAEQCFPGAAFTHQYIPLLPSLKHHATAVYLFFYPYYFTLAVIKEDRLQYLQTRRYTVPEDVLYFILNTRKQYELDKSIDVFCGGFIEEKSKLHDTLYQYLEGFQLIKAGESEFVEGEFSDYAPHYFMPYINYVV